MLRKEAESDKLMLQCNYLEENISRFNSIFMKVLR